MAYRKISSFLRSIAASNGGPLPKRALGKTGLDVTVLGLGGGALVGLKGKEHDRRAEDLVQQAVEMGINYIDTAPEYGPSEARIGAVLGQNRPKIVLATKTHDRTRDGSLRLLEASLKALRTDYVDVWQIHHIDHMDEARAVLAKDGALKALDEAKSQGLARYVGVTGHYDPRPLAYLMGKYDFDTALLAMNAADVHGKHSFIEKALPEAVSQKMGVICMKVTSTGRIFNASDLNNMRDALYYCLSLPVATAIVGVDDVDQLTEDVALAKAFDKLSRAEMNRIEGMTEHYAEIANFFRKGNEVHNPFWKPYGMKSKKATEGKKLIIMRGISGAGKSTLATKLEKEHGTKALSSDGYFMRGGKYVFDKETVPTAHRWNHGRAEEAMRRGDPVVIVDNTNTQAWEMKPYVLTARKHGYSVEFREPDWSPKLKDEHGRWNVDFIEEMQKSKERTDIGKRVPRDRLEQMRDVYQYGVTEKDVLESKMPGEI